MLISKFDKSNQLGFNEMLSAVDKKKL